jgi:hypothetical protein
MYVYIYIYIYHACYLWLENREQSIFGSNWGGGGEESLIVYGREITVLFLP